jgi:hypothetical protein
VGNNLETFDGNSAVALLTSAVGIRCDPGQRVGDFFDGASPPRQEFLRDVAFDLQGAGRPGRNLVELIDLLGQQLPLLFEFSEQLGPQLHHIGRRQGRGVASVPIKARSDHFAGSH